MSQYTMEQYRAAIEAWQKAVDELDQAHAVLRDVGLDKIDARIRRDRMTAGDLVDVAIALQSELELSIAEEN